MTTKDRQLNPKKLRLSKWTDVNPEKKEKHFLVTKVINPDLPAHRIELVEMEAVLTKRNFTLPWIDLMDKQKWEQGWV